MKDGGEKFVTLDHCRACNGAVLDAQGRILEKLDLIEKRLFRDNGSLSIQTRLDRHQQVLKVGGWALGILGGTVLTAAVGAIWLVMRDAVARGVL